MNPFSMLVQEAQQNIIEALNAENVDNVPKRDELIQLACDQLLAAIAVPREADAPTKLVLDNMLGLAPGSVDALSTEDIVYV